MAAAVHASGGGRNCVVEKRGLCSQTTTGHKAFPGSSPWTQMLLCWFPLLFMSTSSWVLRPHTLKRLDSSSSQKLSKLRPDYCLHRRNQRLPHSIPGAVDRQLRNTGGCPRHVRPGFSGCHWYIVWWKTHLLLPALSPPHHLPSNFDYNIMVIWFMKRF